MSLREYYPEIDPYDHGLLDVGDGQQIYWEVCGNPEGKPVVMVHGGPGGGCDEAMRRQFDPAAYRIVLFDQRGCGRSLPHVATAGTSLETNTTWHLVADMELLRKHLGIDRWQVFGGSWGSTLALAYAQTHPDRVTELVLRGIFLLRPSELRWFYQDGADTIFPDEWERYVEPIPPAERDDMIGAYHRRLNAEDEQIRVQAAQAWSVWESRCSTLLPKPQLAEHFDDPATAVAFARIENHYFVNGGFLTDPDQLLRGVDAIRGIPAVIVQGRYDMVCPIRTAWDLHSAWPEAKLVIVDDAGHSATEPGIRSALITATDAFAAR